GGGVAVTPLVPACVGAGLDQPRRGGAATDRGLAAVGVGSGHGAAGREVRRLRAGLRRRLAVTVVDRGTGVGVVGVGVRAAVPVGDHPVVARVERIILVQVIGPELDRALPLGPAVLSA